MWIGFTRSSPAPPSISIGNEMIERVTKFKLLGVTMQNDLKWMSIYKISLRRQVKESIS
jgi:hypothetical protein